MNLKMKKIIVTLVLSVFLVFSVTTGAYAYSRIVAFGDSLSDNGNADGFGFTISSNGPVWVDYLAAGMGVDLLDMAYGGARTYGHPISKPADATTGYDYGFTWQIEQYVNNYNADSSTLYTIWIGGNDLLNLEGNPPASVITNAVTNIGNAIGSLYGDGARNIVLMNMPNLGATPLMNGQNGLYDMPAEGAALSFGFNTALLQVQALVETSYLDLNLYPIDMFALMNEFIIGGSFDNSTNMLAYAGPTDDTYLFWDPIHPTTYAHSLIAIEVAKSVPEPATMLLLGLGLMGLAGIRRKIQK